MVFVTLADAQQLVFRSTDVIGAVLVDGDVGAIPPGAKVISSDEVAADALRPLDGAISSIDLVRVLLWIVAASSSVSGRVLVGARAAA